MTEQPKTEYAVRFTYPDEEPYIRGCSTEADAETLAAAANTRNGGGVARVVSRTVTPWTEVRP